MNIIGIYALICYNLNFCESHKEYFIICLALLIYQYKNTQWITNIFGTKGEISKLT